MALVLICFIGKVRETRKEKNELDEYKQCVEI